VLAVMLLAVAARAAFAREYLQLFVTQPYLQLHTGPGRGYPVTQVIARGESFDVLFRRTEWYKVRTEKGIEGWANEKDMASTVLADGSAFTYQHGDRSGFASHRWESGVFAGSYGGATLISGYEAYSLTDSLKLELHVSQFLGNVSDGYLIDYGLNHVFMPEWRFSPFVTLGGGYERVEPKVTLAIPQDTHNESAYVGIGARFYLTRRFFLRAEYRSHVVFESWTSNEVIKEWKVGFAFFY
jgi:uncharacterized protein YgiM (DUF1202 family)